MAKQRNGLYEGMYILSATLSDESRKKAFDKIVEGITQKEGKILKTHEMGRRKLAYDIDGKREGYYYVLFFEAPTSAIAELWKEYHLHEDLIRFLTMRVEEVQETLQFKPLIKSA
jgi:small subunit ribosomal protein S6